MKIRAVIMVVGALAPMASAAVYTTKASFLANVQSGYYEETFASVGGGPVQMLSFGPINGFAYDVTASTGQLFNDPGLISTDLAGDQLVLTFIGSPVTAVGGNFWATDIAFNVIPSNVTITLSDGTIEKYLAVANSDFRGFTSAVPITKVTIDAADTPANAWATMDNLIVGVAAGGGCYPDCDGTGTLNIDDFICFQTSFAIGDPYADCDASGTLNIDDFICFQTFFAIGC
jgi:hypothetical protein